MTQIPLETDQLRGRKLMIATPMRDGCVAEYAASLFDLAGLAAKLALPITFLHVPTSTISLGRNMCADAFMRSDCTHMLFIDSDMGFRAQDVIDLWFLSCEGPDFDVIAAPYPKRAINWGLIADAVRRGVADADPCALENFTSDYAFNSLPNADCQVSGEPVEVATIGAAFMMIRRETLKKLGEAHPEWRCTGGSYAFHPVICYFQDKIDRFESESSFRDALERVARAENLAGKQIAIEALEKAAGKGAESGEEYVGEDYMFCVDVRRLGMKVWMCPWMELSHIGKFTYSSRGIGVFANEEKSATNSWPLLGA
jgi:hypothetical protein